MAPLEDRRALIVAVGIVLAFTSIYKGMDPRAWLRRRLPLHLDRPRPGPIPQPSRGLRRRAG